MAVEGNGRVVEPGQKAANGHAVAPRSKAAKAKKGFGLFSILTRLFTWYSIVTILVRCPASVDLITDTTPKICKPYFQLSSTISPHLKPYYNTYASPYVEAVRPYYNTLDQRIITPATLLGKKYGSPRVAQAQAYGQAQWAKTVQPQVSKYQSLVKAKYDETLAPHLDKAYKVSEPYFDIAKTSALQTYYEHILPTYTTVQPYALQGYGLTTDFVLDTAIPYSKWAWTSAGIFLDRKVFPQIRILYGENVEPQLVRIGERLGRYRDGKKLKAAVNDIDSSSSASSASSTYSSISSSISSAHATPAPVTSSSPPTPSETAENIPLGEKEMRAAAEKIVANDLKTWQEKFAKAADEGSDELEIRVTEITDRLIQNQAQKVGRALNIQLEETVKSSLNTLKKNIISIIGSSKDEEEKEEALSTVVRKAGVAIKEKAQAVRTWRQSYDRETNDLISKAAEDTFQIIDHIRDLGLQEIGMRWAWTDGITHRDWTKYHKLKGKFDEWRADVEKVVTEHPGLGSARAASEEVESKAMETAEEAAKELARLKETGRWKISTGDSSDDWSTKIMPAVVANAGQKVLDKVSEAVSGTSQGTVESVTSVASSAAADAISSAKSVASDVSGDASSVASSLSSTFIGTPQGNVESVVSVASASASSLANEASSSVIGTQQGSVESIASVAKASASSVVDQASSSIIGTSQGTVESVASVASESASSLSDKVSSSVVGSQPGVAQKASSSIKSAASAISDTVSSLSDTASSSISSGSSKISKEASNASASINSASSSVSSSVSKSASEAASSIASDASTASSTASKKVWGGAMAQFVEAKQIVFEDVIEDSSDDESFSEKIQSMASAAGDKFADITNAVSEAMLKPTATTGIAETITVLAAEKYSSALSAASVALYGTEQGTGESIASVVTSRYADAVSAASAIIYGTPTPLTDSIAAQASQAYSNALSQASEHYEHAKSIVSEQVSGTPKPVHEQMFSSVESAYSEATKAASSRFQAARSAAPSVGFGQHESFYSQAMSAYWGKPTGAFESMSIVASSKLSEGLSAASAHFEDAKTYLNAVQTPPAARQRLFSQMQNQYYAGIGMAHARYSEFLEAASSAVMPTQTPFRESVYNKASEAIIGTPTPAYQAALNSASASYASVASVASQQMQQVLDSIGSFSDSQKKALPTKTLLEVASSKYSHVVAEASSSYESIVSVFSEKAAAGASGVSTAVYGSETPWTESLASAASTNWEDLITKASEQIYGKPTPYFVSRRLLEEAKEYAGSATDAVSSQYSAVQSLIGELVSGKEPDFTESVYSRFSSAYYTGAGAAVSSASSYASEAYQSASSVVSSVFTPPPTLEAILDSASSRVNEVVEAASIQFYGTQKGTYEQATESAASAYSSASSMASEKIYGTQTGYAEAAQSSIAEAASSAQKAISEAIYGTSTGTFESATSVVADAYSSATSVIADNVSAAQAKVSSAIYGPEQSAIESAQARLSAAVDSARIKLAEFAAAAGNGASDTVSKASEGVEDFASSVSSAISSGASRVKDEL